MKLKLLFLALLGFNLAFSQFSFSRDAVQPLIPPVGIGVTAQPSTEIFRFRSGVVTQQDDPFNQNFGFTNSRWFAIGRVPAGSQTFYGQRFQLPNRALVMGYSANSSFSTVSNPIIQWIGTGASLGNLEFRVANTFGVPNAPGNDQLVALMTSNANTVFGTTNPFGNTATSPKVGIVSVNNTALSVDTSAGSGTGGIFRTNTGTGVRVRTNNGLGILIESGTQGMNINSFGGSGFNVSTSGTSGFVSGGTMDTSGSSQENFGLYMKTSTGDNATGIQSFAFDANNNIGVKGTTFGQGNFEAGIYGETPNNNGNNFAGFFDGDVFTTASYLPSDANLKENIANEMNVLESISKLRPVTYSYKNVDGINLSKNKQHGFISQEMADVFPELTKDVTKPVFDKEGKVTSELTFKAINYDGMISILTAGLIELNGELVALKEELANYKAGDEVRKNLLQDTSVGNEFFMEQNTPNPFDNQTTIRYQLSKGNYQASIAVFDLNGKLIKDYSINKNNGELVISSSEIGKGMFLYSLIQNGQELITKKMIVK